MKIDDNKLNELFSEARNQSSQVNVDDVKSNFLAAIEAKNSSGKTSKSAKTKLIKNFKNPFIMLSTIGAIGLTSILIFNNSKPKHNNSTKQNEAVAINQPKRELKVDDTTKIEIINDVISINNEELKMEEITSDIKKEINLINNDVINSIDSIENPIIIEDKNLVEKEVEHKNQSKISQEDELRVKSYTITEKTTEEEIKKIKADAEKAQINFVYRIKEKKGKIRLLSIKLVTSGKVGKRKANNYYYKGSRLATFVYDLSWRENKDGIAIDFNGNGCSVMVPDTPEPPKQP